MRLALSSFELAAIHFQEVAKSGAERAQDGWQIGRRREKSGDGEFWDLINVHRVLAGEMKLAL